MPISGQGCQGPALIITNTMGLIQMMDMVGMMSNLNMMGLTHMIGMMRTMSIEQPCEVLIKEEGLIGLSLGAHDVFGHL